MVFQPMQILSAAQSFFVKTFDTTKEKDSLLVTVQHLERWITDVRDELANPPLDMETFTVSEPVRVQITSLVSLADRGSVFVWSLGPSDVDGCLNLSQPKPLEHTLSLTDKSVPVLSLMDKLDADGFISKLQVVKHTRHGRKSYDKRRPLKSRVYFQCVLHAPSLFNQGAKPFSSGGSHAFYTLLMKFPERALETLSALECSALMRDSRGQAPATLAIVDEEPLLAIVDEDVAGDSDPEDQPVAKKPKPANIVPVVAICDAAPEDPSSSSDSTSSHSVTGDDDVDGVYRIPAFVAGQRAYVEQHAAQPRSKGVKIWCNNPSHVGCNKFRRLHIDRTEFGRDCVTAYLGAWLRASDTFNQRGHQKFKPTRAQMWEYVRSMRGGPM
jgi:hypothetical protein